MLFIGARSCSFQQIAYLLERLHCWCTIHSLSQRNFRSVFRLRRVLRALATAWPIEVCANTHSQALGSPELFCGPVVCSLRLVHFKKITIASLGHLSRSYGCKKMSLSGQPLTGTECHRKNPASDDLQGFCFASFNNSPSVF